MKYFALILLATGCAASPSDEIPGPDAGSAAQETCRLRDPDPGLSTCAPLLNQDLVPWIKTMPIGSCARLRCAEGFGQWELVLCHPEVDKTETFWDIPDDEAY